MKYYLKKNKIKKFLNPAGPIEDDVQLSLILGIRTKEEVDKANQRTKNKMKGLWKGLISGTLLPTLSNIGDLVGSAYNYYISPETTAQGGIAPSPGLTRNPLLLPKGFKFVKLVQLRTSNGLETKNIILNVQTGKFTTLEDFVLTKPLVDLSRYRGEPLTGNEKGFEAFAYSRTPEYDHFANLSHGLENPRLLLPIMNSEFEALPNGARIDLGKTFSGDISSNLLLYAYRNRDRIRMVLPKNVEEVVRSNEHGIKGEMSAKIFNEQLERLLDYYGYSPKAVPKATYDVNTNTLIMPKLSFIKLHKKGNKITWN